MHYVFTEPSFTHTKNKLFTWIFNGSLKKMHIMRLYCWNKNQLEFQIFRINFSTFIFFVLETWKKGFIYMINCVLGHYMFNYWKHGLVIVIMFPIVIEFCLIKEIWRSFFELFYNYMKCRGVFTALSLKEFNGFSPFAIFWEPAISDSWRGSEFHSELITWNP